MSNNDDTMSRKDFIFVQKISEFPTKTRMDGGNLL